MDVVKIPKRATKMQINFPILVEGDSSPYPTDVKVMITTQEQFDISFKFEFKGLSAILRQKAGMIKLKAVVRLKIVYGFACIKHLIENKKEASVPFITHKR